MRDPVARMVPVHFTDLVEIVGRAVDLAGVAVIAGGVLWITGLTMLKLRDVPAERRYRDYRRGIGKAILLGLELLVAADIIRTVAVSPTLAFGSVTSTAPTRFGASRSRKKTTTA